MMWCQPQVVRAWNLDNGSEVVEMNGLSHFERSLASSEKCRYSGPRLLISDYFEIIFSVALSLLKRINSLRAISRRAVEHLPDLSSSYRHLITAIWKSQRKEVKFPRIPFQILNVDWEILGKSQLFVTQFFFFKFSYSFASLTAAECTSSAPVFPTQAIIPSQLSIKFHAPQFHSVFVE